MYSNEQDRLAGSYKISRSVLKRMLGRTVTGVDGKEYPSLSKCEILTMLYFTHIADMTGYIEYVKINELGELLGYSDRNAYHVMDNLVKKGFIESSGNSWTGYYSVKINDNDYSRIRKYTAQNRYLNTNHSFFCRTSDSFRIFANLSLYAVRTFLYIIFNYDALNGYRFSIDRLMDILGIQDKYLCISYLKELEQLLGIRYYALRGSKTKRLKYDIVYIYPGNTGLVSEAGIREDQDSFYKYKWMIYLRKAGIQFGRAGWLTSEIFGIVYTCLKQGKIVLDTIEKVIREVLYEEAENEDMALLGIKLRLAELTNGT